MRVMIIDDSKTMRTVIARTIKELGFEILEAANGREALEQIVSAGAVDLCLVDWHMPEMSGLEFVEKVRAQPMYGAMKLMMVTTAADAEHISQALEAGANEYLMKPFTRDLMLSKLQLLDIVRN